MQHGETEVVGRFGRSFISCMGPVAIAVLLSACGPSPAELETVNYAPMPGQDWKVSPPADQGLDPELVAKLYYKAADVDTIEALLVIKNGYLVAEKYFHNGGPERDTRVQSVTKSFTSALAGIALERGCLDNLDQKMLDFFPELDDQVTDPRKRQITLRQMLQMRAGYPWEESTPELFEMLYHGFRPSLLVQVPLVTDPGTHCEYSNLTSHLIGVVVARACGTDLRSFAEQNLLDPLGVELGDWIQDWEGNYNGHADMYLTARDMARFGLLYLQGGVYEGNQLVPADWVRESFQTWSEDAWEYRVGSHFKDIGYGYQWWSVRAGDHRYNLAWGHGGQQIAVVNEYDMVVVVKADPLFGQHGGGPWKQEKANLNLVADFVASLPVN